MQKTSKSSYDYPQLTRSQDRRCKLTEVEIDEVRKSWSTSEKTDEVLVLLANKFKVKSPLTIKYWVDEEYRKQKIEKNVRYIRRNNIKRGSTTESMRYKNKLQPIEMKEYANRVSGRKHSRLAFA